MLGQLAVEDKSNEITAVPKLLEMLTLRNTVVTADAMHCQRQIARQVVEQGGDYALALKGNQGSLQDDVGLFLGDPATPVAQVVQVSKGHGRIETRMASVSDDVAWLQEWHDWPGLQAVGKVRATRQKDDGTSEETRYYLLSRAFPPERFNDIVRGHWGIENRLHWVLDVTCNEDQARNRKGTLCGEPGAAAEAGPESGAVGTRQRLHARQTEKGRLGQQFPYQHPVPIHQNPYEIALYRKAKSVDTILTKCYILQRFDEGSSGSVSKICATQDWRSEEFHVV